MASTPKIYWTLTRSDSNQTLPFIQRTGRNGGQGFTNTEGIADLGTYVTPSRIYSSNNSIQATDPINVINDFQWTKSPIESRVNTPSITLIEKRLLMNSNIANLANSVFAGGTSVVNLYGENARSLAEKGIDNAPDSIESIGRVILAAAANERKIIAESQNRSDIANALSKAKAATLQATGETVLNLGKYASSFQLGNPVLRPYDFLYATEVTGFQYVLPYFSNSYNNTTNAFGESENNFITGLTNIASDFAAGAAGIGGFLKPGTYIEKAKQFSMGDSGRNLEIKFPLLNTGEYKDIIENWQLIFGILYQNRPGRVTRAIIDVPVIYEVYSQGTVYMPFAFINNFSVNFLGNRRMMKIQVPVGLNPGEKSITIETIIPDAYEVTITLTGLNDETRNFLYTNVTKGPVTVSK
jgi:hypothetical protein